MDNNQPVNSSSKGKFYIYGNRGYSAYEVAVLNGFVGTEEEWLLSLTGPQGPEGPQGPQGPTGLIPEMKELNFKGIDFQSASQITDNEIINNINEIMTYFATNNYSYGGMVLKNCGGTNTVLTVTNMNRAISTASGGPYIFASIANASNVFTDGDLFNKFCIAKGLSITGTWNGTTFTATSVYKIKYEYNMKNYYTKTELDEGFAKYTSEKLTDLTCEYNSDIKCYYTLLKLKRDKFSLNQIYQSEYSNGIYDYLKNTENCFVLNGQLAGVNVSNGVGKSESSTYSQYWYILGIDNNNNFIYTKDLTRTETTTDLINNGYKEAFGIWCPVIVNGTPFNPEDNVPSSQNDYDYIINGKHPRTILGYDDDYLYLLIIEGRLANSRGATFNQMVTLCQELGIANAFNMDGGGSSQLWTSKHPKNLRFGSDKTRVPYTSRNLFALLKFEKED